ncbi:MAG: sorbosone dehydrogenase, partial [Betaproteobacteria bacterium]|nr:sorbosone dehydrogenase [Betaproteobacteria bacterium]
MSTVQKSAVAAAVAAALLGGVAQAAPDNLSTLKQMKVATTDLNIPVVPQEGKNADAIRANL